MSRLGKLWLAAGGALAGPILLAGFLHTSAWFLWELFPEEDLQIFVQIKAKAGHILTEAAQAYRLEEYLPFPTSMAQSLLYARSADSTRLIILPTLGKGRQLRQSLRQNGWDTKWLGLLLIGEQGRPIPKISWRNYFSPLLTQHTPRRPALLAKIPSGRLVAFAEGHALEVSFQAGSTWPAPIKPSVSLIQAEDVAIQMPGHFLALLPPSQREAWNSFVRQKLQLTHTTPDILASLDSQSQLRLRSTPDIFELGIQGNSATFAQLAEAWFSQDLAAASPVIRAFRLPDGTLGYEKRPGEPPPVFTHQSEGSSCQESTGLASPIFLCKDLETARLSNVQGSSISKIKSPSGSWYGIAGEEFLAKIPWLDATSLQAWGGDDWFAAVVTLPDRR